MNFLWFTAILLLSSYVTADYQCVCSYNIETPIYTKANQNSTKLGYMYEFDCRPTAHIGVTTNPAWLVVAYQHQAGYVHSDNQIKTQICPGSPSDADIYCSATRALLVEEHWPGRMAISGVNLDQGYNKVTPTVPPKTTTSTYTTELASKISSATLSSTTTTTTTTITTATATKPTIFTMQSSTLQASTTARTSLPSTPSRSTTHRSTTPSIPGNVRLCHHTLHQYTIEDKGALAQFGDSCYEIVPIQTTWLKGEKDCIAKGGHLFHISNQQEQDFILAFINFHQFSHACWMGLHDQIAEEMFEWTSGDNVTYTNWWHDRYGNIMSHHLEDCVLFVPYSPYFGKWDDVPCGYTDALGVDQVKINPFICQFSIHGNYNYVPLSSSSSIFGKRAVNVK